MATLEPVAIVDIGSNSVRLVVYAGAARAPSVVFNEKVMAGLGSRLADTGALGSKAQERALAALRRFRILVRQMKVPSTRCVATAAVRDASNGAEFLAAVREIGFEPELLSGEEEGRMAGQGVLCAIPEADGIAGDLGGGSLELADLADGGVTGSISLPLGVLRVGAVEKGDAKARRELRTALEETGLGERGRGRPFYMIGGSWRTLARLDMISTGYPLPITHHYRMKPSRPPELDKLIPGLAKADPKTIATLTASRIATLPTANLLLSALVEELRPSELIVSSFGIREGLLYDDMSKDVRRLDPLIEAVREAGRGLARFGEHGALLDNWIAPIFDDEPEMARLRLASCLLSDVAWQAHPNFRAERGLEMALHGSWVGVDAPGRVLMAQALFSSFGGGPELPDKAVAALAPPRHLERAALWGLAMRLGQRLSGGVSVSLQRSRLSRLDGKLYLGVEEGEQALAGETVAKRLGQLAASLGCRPQIATL